MIVHIWNPTPERWEQEGLKEFRVTLRDTMSVRLAWKDGPPLR